MNKTKTPIKESKFLQYLVQTGDDIDTVRKAVLQCVCEYHGIQDPDIYINSEAVLRYVYQPWEREDDLVVDLYSRKEHDPVEDYKDDPHGIEAVLRQPRTVVYSLAYTVVTPVSVVEAYLTEHYTIFDGTYLGVRKKL